MIARILVNATIKIASSNYNVKKGIDGALELRLIAPIFLYAPHRGNNVIYNNQQKALRERLFKERKWSQLLEQMLYEQKKKNAKTNRKLRR